MISRSVDVGGGYGTPSAPGVERAARNTVIVKYSFAQEIAETENS